ncbi:caspase family protein [Amycolatopsis sp. NPDC089917]|uniref:caspase, EACC1-associated type n=1 Tax=Amycolatopsis sp. NPDC089917 TaxID=3155187 RepID=UPI00343AEBF7
MTAPRAGLPDPRKSRAVLVGVSDYATLEELPGVANNIATLGQAMTDPELWGLSEEHCVTLLNPESPDEVMDAVHRAATEATDALLFYYAGHGLLDNRFELYLAMPGSDNERLYRSVRYDDIRREVVGTALSCYGKVVLLDCCYSGRALQGGMGGSVDDLADQARVDGTYVMTATAETRKALAPPGERYTAFTGALVDKLTRGLPEGPELLDMETLFYHVKADLQARHFPVPQQRSRNDGSAIVLVRNRWNAGRTAVERPVATPRSLPRPPAGFEQFLRRRPADVYAEVRTLRAHDQQDIAERLLVACAALRPDQEVAAIVGLLRRSGADADAGTVLMVASRRAPEEVVGILDALYDTDLPSEAGFLLYEAGSGPVGDSAALAHLLQKRGRASDLVALLDSALDSAQAGSSLIDLVNALWVAGLREEVDSLIGRTVTRLPAPAVLTLADELRSVGREEAAFGLYAASAEAMVSRPPDVVAQLCHAMAETGRPADSETVAEAVIGGTGDVGGLLAIALAFWDTGQEKHVERVLTRAAKVLPDDAVIIFVAELRAHGQDDAAHRFCVQAMLNRSAQSIRDILAELRDEGWPVLAKQVLDEVSARASVATVAEFLAVSTAADRHRVLSLAGERERDYVAKLLKKLMSEHSFLAREFADRITTKAENRTELLPVVIKDLDSRYKEQVLARVVDNNGGPELVTLLKALPLPDAKYLMFLIVRAGQAKFLSVVNSLPGRDPHGFLRGQSVERLPVLVNTLLTVPHGERYTNALLDELAAPERGLPAITQELSYLFDEDETVVGKLLLGRTLTERSSDDLKNFVQAVRIEGRPVVLAATAEWVKEHYEEVGATDGILRRIGLPEYASRRSLFGKRAKA